IVSSNPSWIMTLPTLLEDQLFNEITEFEEKKNMPVLTTAEKKGIQQGIQRGTIAGLKMALQDILELKFGEAGKKLYQKIEPVEDLEVLQRLRHALKKAKNVAAAEKIIQDALGG
ncbi:MAG: hypothetical protein Q9P14_19025, partial [candidate division KSB1 bacterium]|nr:hypothetical protein [candidate division KSB1 bacterium]